MDLNAIDAPSTSFAAPTASVSAAMLRQVHGIIPLRVYIKLAFVGLFWGGTFSAGRIIAQAVPHMLAAAGRFAIACALLLILAHKLEGGLPRLSRQQLIATFALGITGIFIYNLTFSQRWRICLQAVLRCLSRSIRLSPHLLWRSCLRNA
jgi:hypothetical protein